MNKYEYVAFAFCLCLILDSHRIEAAACQHEHRNSQFCEFGVPEDQPYMTAYHFRPAKNWMNDPNGPMYYRRIYHLFYQYNPASATFGDMVWAHSVSYDLINWIHLNSALEPSEPYDRKGCWSGSITILPGGKPVIFYTGGSADDSQVQNLAEPKNLSDPFLREWEKYPANPVINVPSGILKDNFRDPTTAWQGPDGIWRVFVGSQQNEDGLLLLYTSKDFIDWIQYEHPFYLGKPGMWECPDFFPVYLNSTKGVDTSVLSPAVKHVLKASFALYARDYYLLGSYDPDTERFTPESGFMGSSSDLRYDYGKYYATKSFFDTAKNRRINWGWVNESDTEDNYIKRGWSGLQAIPRSVWLDKSGEQLIQWPIEEIEMLREKEVSIIGKELRAESVLEVPDITASQADVEVIFELPNLEEAELMDPSWDDPSVLCSKQDASFKNGVGPFGLLVFATKDLSEQTAIFFRVFKGQSRYIVLMCSDQSRSSLRQDADKTTYGAFVNVDPQNEKIALRSLMDHSIVESFGGEGRTCITARVYPVLATGKDAHLYIFNNGKSSVVVSKLTAWSMKEARMAYEEEHLTNNVNRECKDERYDQLGMCIS